MSYTFIEHSIYLILITGIILRVGHLLHQAGASFVHLFLPHNPAMATQVNNLLLVGYYLVNIGYAFLMLVFFADQPQDFTAVLEGLATKIGGIVLILGILHVNNMALIYFFTRKSTPMSHIQPQEL